MFDFLTNSHHRTPQIYLAVRTNPSKDNSKDISTLISQRLISLTLTDNRGFEADQLDIVLDDADGTLALPNRKAILSLGLGWRDEPLIFKGEYRVDEVEHSGSPDILTIRARSADLRGSLTNRYERSFHRTTLGAIVKQIAEENQLTPVVSEEYQQLDIAHLDQTNESSLNLLSRLAEEHDAIATIKSERLLFIKAGKSQTVNGNPLPEFVITRQDGDTHRFSIAEGENYTTVKAYWHDIATGKRGEVIWDKNTEIKQVVKPTTRKVTRVKRGKAGEAKLDKKGRVQKDKQGNIKTYKKGKILKDAQGNSIKETVLVQGKGRKVNEISHTQPIESDADKIKTLNHTYASQQTAINACKRIFGKLQRNVATFSLTLAVGNAELIPEASVTVQGFKPEIDSAQWIITQVTHTVSTDNGFTSAIECELRETN